MMSTTNNSNTLNSNVLDKNKSENLTTILFKTQAKIEAAKHKTVKNNSVELPQLSDDDEDEPTQRYIFTDKDSKCNKSGKIIDSNSIITAEEAYRILTGISEFKSL